MAKAAKAPAKTGRPSSFSQKVADEICRRIAEGESLRAICSRKGLPSLSTVFKWLTDFPSFSQQYARAREEQAETLAGEIVAIADETPEVEPVLDKDGNVIEMRLHPAYVSWQKNRVDARKWVAAKLKPKVYGDKVQTEVSGPEGGPIETVELTPREVAQRAAFLLAKGAKAK